MSAREKFSQILICLSNDTRRQIIHELATKPRTYTQLMDKLNMIPDSQTGLLNYHLRKMRLAGVITRTRDGYRLTDLGTAASRIIDSLESQIDTGAGREKMQIKVESYVEGSLSQRASNRAKANGAPVDECYISGRKDEGLRKHIFADLGVSATQIAKIGDRLAGVLPAYTTSLHREKAGDSRYGFREPDKSHPANWTGGSFHSPWIDPDFAGQEEEVERGLVKAFAEHCRKIGAAEILADEIPVEDDSFLKILAESGFRDYRRTAYLTLKL
jgi:DNA-binding HxlR family transcriptional regulator